MNRRIFTGTDPGTKGACAVIAVADCPDDDAQHGRILDVEVFDLPVIARDSGGHELDVATFKVTLRAALANVCGGAGGATGCDGLVEYPVLTAGFGGGVRQKVQQGVNAGAVWAALKSTGLVQVAWVDSDKWRGEICSSKGDETEDALDVVRGSPVDLAMWQDCNGVGRVDRAVAVLLAEVARRRWLGTAVAPKTTGTARAAKARKADLRKAAIARAVAPLTVAKARVQATSLMCGAHGSDVPPLASCLPRNKCCEARLLDWAWQRRPDLPGLPIAGPLREATDRLPWTVAIFKRATTSKAWTVSLDGDGLPAVPMAAEVFDVLEAHGLVQMCPNERQVRYRPTPRGLVWAAKLAAANDVEVKP